MDTQTPTRLTRSRDDRLLGGVAGGVAEFLGLDPTLVRVVFVLLTLFGGSGAVIYLAMWLLVPPADDAERPVDRSIRAGVGEIREAARGLAGDVRSGWQGEGGTGPTVEEPTEEPTPVAPRTTDTDD